MLSIPDQPAVDYGELEVSLTALWENSGVQIQVLKIFKPKDKLAAI